MTTFVYVLIYKDAYSIKTNLGVYTNAQKSHDEADRLCKSMPNAWKRGNFETEALILE